jgi:DNA-binding MarR family transcriptional regulator
MQFEASTGEPQRYEAWMMATRLGIALDRVHAQWRRLLGLNVHECLSICVLWERGSMPMGELAGHIGLSKAAMTSLVDSLEQKDLLSRVPDQHDRRRTMLQLDEGWAAAIEPVLAQFEQSMGSWAAQLPEGTWSNLVSAMDVMYTVVDEHARRTSTIESVATSQQ